MINYQVSCPMKIKILNLSTLLLFVLLTTNIEAQVSKSQNVTLTVDVNKPSHKIPQTLFGIFFEDINLSTDGGIYPEFIRNRSFEDADTPENWQFISSNGKSLASIKLADVQSGPPIPPLNPFNRKSLNIQANGDFKLLNKGYWGMNIIKGDSYSFKLAARVADKFNSPLQIRLISSTGEELASGEIKDFGLTWKYYELILQSSGSDTQAHLEISGSGTGNLYLDMISILPDKTWKNHGLRIDLAEAINALNPAFFRFPGGCWVEGDDFAHMNNWKQTIGNIDTRTSLYNIWGYNATNGLGYHEYLQLSEDLGAEPLYCINAGISHKEIVPMDQMGQWIQDALDAIEYANGPINSVWGSIRAKNGHPEPFNLKYLEIGNENGQEPYAIRWKMFVEAIKQKYPDIILIANEWAGSHPKNPVPSIVDEHYYNNPEWFIWNSNKYDDYDRTGPKIFVGEYAVNQNAGNGNLRAAIGEAAWMTGMERNSDVVVMSAYAPLFCNSNHKRWPVNLINFDSYRWYGLPGYYVQQMFALNQGTISVPVEIENSSSIVPPYSKGRIGLGTWNNTAEFKDLKVVSPEGKILYETDFSKGIDEWTNTETGEWTVDNGVLRQSSLAQNITAFVGDTSWTDYTITLKARKLHGDNGFQIYFRNLNLNQRVRWDLGGYINSIHLMDMGIISESVEAGIESGKWYDIKLEIKGNSVKGYLDGKLIQYVTDSRMNGNSLSASASINELTNEVIIKVVNASHKSVTSDINLAGVEKLSGTGKTTVLTSPNPLDENSLDEPFKVFPKTGEIKLKGNKLKHDFPGNSFTIFRIPLKTK